ncbi:hypothetical protein R0137_06400 [Congregibacter brevis]|uniref:Phage integrase family protein n=1 Tax=Congregibacter brevis TaxID=3081201 RepID=A0ABZ0IGM7_9GAMM|nr:hypothetical protein R0137_06400 [Congregibacter sp. IMCC45268]
MSPPTAIDKPVWEMAGRISPLLVPFQLTNANHFCGALDLLDHLTDTINSDLNQHIPINNFVMVPAQTNVVANDLLLAKEALIACGFNNIGVDPVSDDNRYIKDQVLDGNEVPAMLVQPATFNDMNPELLQLLKHLYLAYCYRTPNRNSIIDVANELRTACMTTSAGERRRNILQHIPSSAYAAKPSQIVLSMRTAFGPEVTFAGVERKFARSLALLASSNAIPTVKAPNYNVAERVAASNTSRQRRPNLAPAVRRIGELRLRKRPETTKPSNRPPSLLDRRLSEPPDRIHIPKPRESIRSSRKLAESTSAQRFWIVQAENINPASNEFLSPGARDYLRSLFTIRDKSPVEYAGLMRLLATIYGTDSDPKDAKHPQIAMIPKTLTIPLPLPNTSWKPSADHDESFHPQLESISVKLRIPRSPRFTETLKMKNVDRACRNIIRRLGRLNGSAIKNKSLRILIHREVLILSRNLLTGGLLDYQRRPSMPAMAWYMGLRDRDLQRAFADACESLLGISTVNSGLNDERESQIVDEPTTVSTPKFEEFRMSMMALRTETASVLRSPSSSIDEKHDRYTKYTLVLLHFYLGFRPINDPLGTLSEIDLEGAFCLIADKVTNPALAYRLLSLPPEAKAQLNAYREYLKWLAATLYSSRSTQKTARTIERLLRADANQPIPLFFRLTNNSRKIRRITFKEQQGWFSSIFPVAPNEGRRWIATQLHASGIPYPWIAVILGHHEQTMHAFGRYSMYTPQTVLEEVAQALDLLGKKLGLLVLKRGKTLTTTLKKQLVELNNDPSKDVWTLTPAYKLRQQQRRDSRAEYLTLIRESLNPVADLPKGTVVDKKRIKKLQAAVLSRAVSRGLSAHQTLKLFDSVLRVIRRKGIRVAISSGTYVDPEPSPFTKKILQQYAEARELRHRWQQHLKRLGTEQRKSTIPSSSADVVTMAAISAALTGRLASAELLKRLATGNFTGFFLNGSFYTAICADEVEDVRNADNTFLWQADEATSSLLIQSLRVNSSHTFSDAPESDLYSSLLPANASPSDAIDQLAAAANVLNLIETPGIFRSITSRDVLHRSIQLSTVARLLSKKPLLAKSQTDSIPAPNNARDMLPTPTTTTTTPSHSLMRNELIVFRRWINRHANDHRRSIASDTKGKTHGFSRTLDNNLKATFADFLDTNRFTSDHGSSERNTTNALKDFIAYQCRETGGRHKKWTTIREYHQIVMRGIILVCPYEDFSSLPDYAFEDSYLMIIDCCPQSSRKKCLNALRQFHDFLMERYHAEPVDWSYVLAAGEWDFSETEASINPSYVFPWEYHRTLQSITNAPGDSNLKDQLAAQIILGFRFGMRWSEAIYMRRCDVIGEIGGKDFLLAVRSHRFRGLKTRASSRRISLIGQLDTLEKSILERVIAYSDTLFEFTPQARKRYLFHLIVGANAKIGLSDASAFVNQTIRLATGDSTSRFHHLRHSFCSAAMMVALDPIIQTGEHPLFTELRSALLQGVGLRKPHWPALWPATLFGPHSLQTVSNLLGHAGIGTSVTAYSHFWPITPLAEREPLKEMSDGVLSAFLGEPYSRIQQRRARARRDGQPTNLESLSSKVPDERLVNLTSYCQKRWTKRVPEVPDIHDAGALTTNIFHACRISLKHSVEATSIEQMGKVCNLDPEAFLRAAINAEQCTGFTRYEFKDSQSVKRATIPIAQLLAIGVILNSIASRIEAAPMEICDNWYSSLASAAPRFDRRYNRFRRDSDTDELDFANTLGDLKLSLSMQTIEPDLGTEADTEIRSDPSTADLYVSIFPGTLTTYSGFRHLLFMLILILRYRIIANQTNPSSVDGH